MKRHDWFLRVMVTLLVVGVWGLILRPVLLPVPSQAAPGKEAAKVVRAERFEMVDSQGRVQATLGVKREGPGYVLVLHSSGKVHVNQPVRAGRFEVPDSEGKVCATLQMRDGRSPALTLYHWVGNDRHARVELYLVEDDGTGRPELKLSDAEGRLRAGLGLGRDGSPFLGLFDKAGKEIWQAPPD
jgi:hypothetical protein